MSPAVWAVVPAAGNGSRMGADRPKQYLDLLGRPLIHWSLDALLDHPEVAGAVVALASDDPFWGLRPYDHLKPLHRVEGGGERWESVGNALRHLQDTGEGDILVLVHDAARPCLSRRELDALLSVGRAESDGALLAHAARDTLKREEEGRAAGTVPRDGVWQALTPQLFPLATLIAALDAASVAGRSVTDESSAMELAGYRPRLVEGSLANLKVTHPGDLELAAAILAARERR